MSQEAVVQRAKNEVKASEVAPAVVGKTTSVSAKAKPAAAKAQLATAAAGKKVTAKPLAAKKVAAKAVQKPVVEKLAPKTPTKPVKKAVPKVAADPKAVKAKKPKLVRDSFTVPESDYALFATIKQRALTAGVEVKKGEVLRAALATLAKLDDTELIKAIGLVERIKTGRPKK